MAVVVCVAFCVLCSECFQYTDKCSSQQVTGVIAPFQQQYIDEYKAFAAKDGNGGFFHSCHLGGCACTLCFLGLALFWLRHSNIFV